MSVIRYLKRKVQRPRLNDRTFKQLVTKYGLEGKIDLNESTMTGYTLVPIISEQGEVPQLPGGFLREFFFLLFHGKNPWRKNWGFFQIQPKTLQQIQKEIDSWNIHCELFWQAAD